MEKKRPDPVELRNSDGARLFMLADKIVAVVEYAQTGSPNTLIPEMHDDVQQGVPQACRLTGVVEMYVTSDIYLQRITMSTASIQVIQLVHFRLKPNMCH